MVCRNPVVGSRRETTAVAAAVGRCRHRAAVWLGELGGHGIVIGLVISTLWALAMAFIGSLNSGGECRDHGMRCGLGAGAAIAGHSSGMVAAMAAVTGGLIQAITALLPPWSKNHPERHALASAYRDLAAYARGLALKLTEPLPTESLLDTDTTIGERRRVPEALREASSQLYEPSCRAHRRRCGQSTAAGRRPDGCTSHGSRAA